MKGSSAQVCATMRCTCISTSQSHQLTQLENDPVRSERLDSHIRGSSARRPRYWHLLGRHSFLLRVTWCPTNSQPTRDTSVRRIRTDKGIGPFGRGCHTQKSVLVVENLFYSDQSDTRCKRCFGLQRLRYLKIFSSLCGGLEYLRVTCVRPIHALIG
jgi:hypothetical protein